MRNLRANTMTIWYARYEGKEEILLDGKRTGQHREVYGDPVSTRISASADRGSATAEMFGLDLQYDRTMTSTLNLPINEYAKVWIGCTPEDGPANYIVKRYAPGINQNTWALAKVVTDGDND